MYDLPQLKAATDALWQAITERLRSSGVTPVPATLNRTDDYAQTWANPALLLGQACGYPLLKHLQDKAQIVATPIYEATGCEGADHASLFIVNAKAQHRSLSDLRHSICALNGYDSNTGMNLLRAAIAPMAQGTAFFQSIVVTGAHYNSLKAVANGSADLAAIDSVSFAHFQHYEPTVTGCVKVIGQSAKTTTPPFITSSTTDAQTLAALRKALMDVGSDPKLEQLRSTLLINGFTEKTTADYAPILRLEQAATDLGYPSLR